MDGLAKLNKKLHKKIDQEVLVHACLPDTLVNKYMKLITALSPNTMYAFNTHFFTVLSDKGFSRIHRWTKNVDIFSKERLFIPIHIKSNSTWSLINVNFKDKSIRFYDSLGNRGIKYQKLILKYLRLEYLMKKGRYFPSNGWRLTNLNSIDDGFKSWDSGLFMCFAARHFAHNSSGDATLTFTSAAVGGEKSFRKKIVTHMYRNVID